MSYSRADRQRIRTDRAGRGEEERYLGPLRAGIRVALTSLDRDPAQHRAVVPARSAHAKGVNSMKLEITGPLSALASHPRLVRALAPPMRVSGVWKDGIAMTVGLGLGVTLALGLGGCGGSPAASSASAVGATSSSVFSTCDTETRALPYQAGLHVNSSAGGYQVKLVEALPSAAVSGQATWTIEVTAASGSGAASPGAPSTGQAIDGLEISAAPFMPDHGHGTAPVAVTPKGQGRYELSPVHLFMSGYWEVKLGLKQGPASAIATAPSTTSTSTASAPTTAAQDQAVDRAVDQAVIPVCIR
jgi:hypothetical protein